VGAIFLRRFFAKPVNTLEISRRASTEYFSFVTLGEKLFGGLPENVVFYFHLRASCCCERGEHSQSESNQFLLNFRFLNPIIAGRSRYTVDICIKRCESNYLVRLYSPRLPRRIMENFKARTVEELAETIREAVRVFTTGPYSPTTLRFWSYNARINRRRVGGAPFDSRYFT
jgi:hypothetical protein